MLVDGTNTALHAHLKVSSAGNGTLDLWDANGPQPQQTVQAKGSTDLKFSFDVTGGPAAPKDTVVEVRYDVGQNASASAGVSLAAQETQSYAASWGSCDVSLVISCR